MYSTLLTGFANSILTVTINRPDKLNAINRQVMSDLNTIMDEVYSNKEIRSVIITGAGSKAFVAGADISELIGLNEAAAMETAKYGQDVFFKIENCPKPVVAAINGFALGGGCELAMACHFRIAAEQAKFGQPEVHLGLIPGYGGTQRLPALIGKGRAFEFLLTGKMLDAGTALQWGLVNYIVPLQELLDRATALLEIINAKAPVAISRCIGAVNHAGKGLEGYELEILGFGKCFATSDMKEGTAAFLEKRTPHFKGE